VNSDNPGAIKQRVLVAVAFMIVLHLASIIPRLFLYGSDVFPSTLLRLVLLTIELLILVVVSAVPGANSVRSRTLGGGLFFAACIIVTYIEQRIEAAAPGTIYPTVLYRQPPSFSLAIVSSITEGIFRLALWILVYVFPLKLDELRRNAAEAIQLEQTRGLSQRRARLDPSWIQASLAEISTQIDIDPRSAREKLAAFAEYLDHHSERDESASMKNAKTHLVAAPFQPSLAIPTPSLRSPLARQRFAVAVLTIVTLFALNSLSRFAEHGRISLWLDVTALIRIVIELGLFVAIAEHAASRGITLTRAIAATFLGSIVVGTAMTLVTIGLESSFPGTMFPRSIFTHPTPPIRQLVRAATTAFIDVGFWTLVYLYPLASAEATKRAAATAILRREVELSRLRAMLAPHFVRNALNVIAGQVTADPEQAQTLLQGLGKLLSDLETDEEHHSIGQEIAWLRAYASLLEARHPDLLSIRFDIDPHALDIVVPRLLLQPLVENAVIHGALARQEGGTVRIAVDRHRVSEMGEQVHCVVEDDGPGMHTENREGRLGVRLVRERLAALAHGGRLAYQSSNAGTSAIVQIPLGRRT